MLNNNGYYDSQLKDLALERLRGSRARFRVSFNEGNLAVLPPVRQDSRFRTNTLKLRRKLLEKEHGRLIAEICNTFR